MARIAVSLALVTTLMTGLALSERDADACGVKLAVKTVRQRQRAKTPVNAGDHDVIAARPDRTPVRAGPEPAAPRPVVAAKGSENITPAPKPPTPAPTVVAAAQPPAPTPAPPPPTPAPAPAPPPAPEHIATVTPPAAETAPPKHEHATAAALDREVYFSVGSATLGSKGSLDKAATWLAANPGVHASVEGYADPTGTPDGNMALSQSRAEAARDYLVQKGVDSSRLEVMAFGDTKMKYGRSDGRNRRVAIEAKQ